MLTTTRVRSAGIPTLNEGVAGIAAIGIRNTFNHRSPVACIIVAIRSARATAFRTAWTNSDPVWRGDYRQVRCFVDTAARIEWPIRRSVRDVRRVLLDEI